MKTFYVIQNHIEWIYSVCMVFDAIYTDISRNEDQRPDNHMVLFKEQVTLTQVTDYICEMHNVLYLYICIDEALQKFHSHF